MRNGHIPARIHLWLWKTWDLPPWYAGNSTALVWCFLDHRLAKKWPLVGWLSCQANHRSHNGAVLHPTLCQIFGISTGVLATLESRSHSLPVSMTPMDSPSIGGFPV